MMIFQKKLIKQKRLFLSSNNQTNTTKTTTTRTTCCSFCHCTPIIIPCIAIPCQHIYCYTCLYKEALSLTNNSHYECDECGQIIQKARVL